MEITTKSEKETYDFAKKYAKKLKGDEVIGLVGDLGAGKTVFAQGLAAGLGVKETVNSPTFVLMKLYPVKQPGKIKFLCHIDAYRITKAQDIIAIGAEEYLNRPDTVTVVEWADRIKNVLPSKTSYFNFTISSEFHIISTQKIDFKK